MIILPPVFQIGPFAVAVAPLLVVVGIWTTYLLSRYECRRYSLSPAWLEQVMWRMLIAAWAGAKLPDLIRSPVTFLANPRLWLAWPAGRRAAVGALIAAITVILISHLGNWKTLLSVLDTSSWPSLVGLAVAAAGIEDARALPLMICFALASMVVILLRQQASFPGHTFLAALIMGCLAVTIGDIFRPSLGDGPAISLVQILAIVTSLVAFAIAWWRDGLV